MNKKKDYTLLIIICIILISLLGLMFFKSDEEENLVNEENKKYILLNDYSRFFTIDGCVDKFINFITNKDTESMLNILDSKYIEQNNINADNVFQYIDKLNGMYSFKAKKIYYEDNKSNVIKYYVYGHLIEEQMDSISKTSDYYLVLNIDTKNNLFSISPYGGDIFKEDINE